MMKLLELHMVLSANGWVDSELFKGWLSEHFIAHAVGARSLLLLLDGHSHLECMLCLFSVVPG